ncbi:hypothetical protein IQ270_27525 [Microcoleus sp. LEGE 07076]|uniref:hypothetical protein n=1 Tax=Microcoleus sp. LEGE 07076 TaxID=915322 RepID=UPI0018817BA7|nr:hypothetical protein [Microcoleus sp. LEGE 07076]MBE9188283.1 hypothetical protein [Microcoleus sp. LEGE 07076]
MVGKDNQSSPEPNEKSTEVGLNELALETQRHPPKSFEDERAWTRLVSELSKPGQLSKPKHPSGLSASEYNQVSEVTKQETDLALVQFTRRKKFDPEKGNILHLARHIQSKKHIDSCLDHRGIHRRTQNGEPVIDILVSADRPISNHQSGDAEESNMTYLDQFTSQEHDPSFLEQFRQIMVQNPQNIFGKPMSNRQDVTLQKIGLLWLDGYTWDEISEILSVKFGSVSSFFSRAIKNPELVAQVKIYLAQFLFIVAILLNSWDIN